MIGEWALRAAAYLPHGQAGSEFVRGLLREHTRNEKPLDAEDIATDVAVQLAGVAGLAAANRAQLDRAIETALASCLFDSSRQHDRASKVVRKLLSPAPSPELLERIAAAHNARVRATYDLSSASTEVLQTVAGRRSTWTEANIRSAVEDRVGLCEFDSDQAHRDAVEEVTGHVRDRLSIQLTIDPDPTPAALARRNGESIFTVTGAIRYTSQAVLDAEARLINAARTPTTISLPDRAVDKSIADIHRDQNVVLGDDQRAIARYLCGSGMLLSVAVGPAGSGKTTAMRAVSDAWQASGRTVVALAPSASAARVLGTQLDLRAKTIATLLTQAHHGLPTGVTPGTMILIDEATMAATADLDAVLRHASAQGAIIRCIADPGQLSAVQAGGIIRTIARDLRVPQLHRLIRFSDPEEAQATLAVRSGDVDAAWDFYATHGRISHGMNDELRQEILHEHLQDRARGISSLMIAATLDDVAALNAAAQAAHATTGHIQTTGTQIPLSDGHTGYPGDVIITRLNNRRLRITGGTRTGTQIDNGDLWHIHRIHPDNTITATGIGHRGSIHLPAEYIRHHVELGYATTIYRAEGATADHAHILMNETLGRALAYVGLTRGRHLNRIYLATDKLIDLSGDEQPDDPSEPHQVFAKVLAREDDNLSATDIIRSEQAAADRRRRAAYTHACRHLATAHSTYLLDRALPTVFFHAASRSANYQTLLDTVSLAEAHGLDAGELVAAICTDNHRDFGQSLTNARDTAAVLRARADIWISEHLGSFPTTASPDSGFRALRDLALLTKLPATHPGHDAELTRYATELHDSIHRTAPVADQPHSSTRPTAVTDNPAVVPANPPRSAPPSTQRRRLIPRHRLPMPVRRRRSR
ncbi:hypothetical protein D5S18_18780 [Nocardia panacis]|uniref:AAA+ ATPase domain-containing protein n=1 Tax=Nocardia panacis TaxID=2340916 RepID=A0A3A4K8I3_9NOCA|nr:AAA family ATPase [Nocardia panacis]RJO74007.1 hypothetical protein D5S18_18780 [Nocardia panacis]